MVLIAQFPLPAAVIFPAAAITKQAPIAYLKNSMPNHQIGIDMAVMNQLFRSVLDHQT